MPSILIIDDDVTILAPMVALLEEAGYEVARSSDVRHGELLYAERRPDLVILEVRAGGDKGWELLGRLAAETPVLVVSGAAHEEDVVRAFDEGAADHIAKPYRSAELLARLRARLAAPQAALAQGIPAEAPAVYATPQAQPGPPAAEAPASAAVEAHRTAQRRNRRGQAPVDESVFMSEAEEMALLRTPPVAAPDRPEGAPAPDVGEGGLGRRMRAERMRRHLTLVQIENELKIRMSYLQAMEDEKLTLLPRGPAAPQMVRDYASFLGLDPNEALEELRAQQYGEAVAPIPALGGAPAPRSLPRWLIILAAVLLALAVGVGAIMLFDPGFFLRLPEFLQGLVGGGG